MQKYPDKIVILEVKEGGTPYKPAGYVQVYSGPCRCFLNKPAAFRTVKMMDCDYGVVVPDRHMIAIGENFKVGIKLHNSKSTKSWDLVGYVKDFARYDRVCNIYFQMTKENLIEEDMPPGGEIEDWPIIKGMDMQHVSFYGADTMTELPFWALNGDWSNAETMKDKFNGCSVLTAVDIFTATNTTSLEQCFANCLELTNIRMPDELPNLVNDWRTWYWTFAYTPIEEMYIPDNPCINMNETFRACAHLKKVVFTKFTPDKYDIDNPGAVCVWTKVFVGCEALKELIVVGTLGGRYNNFTETGLEDCELTTESIGQLINSLYDGPEQDGDNNIFNFGSANLAKVNDAMRAIATEKGWILT